MKDKLYEAAYWYFRHKYATVCDLVEKENNIKINSTKNAELFAENSIKELINFFDSVGIV